ncbi:MAG: phage tail protein [Acidobacteriota bacterium]
MTILPFTSFNFRVVLEYEKGKPICDAEFSEVGGLEVQLAPKTIREGGNNRRPIHLLGPVSYGQLTLKRGMTQDFGLWDWFAEVQKTAGHGVRASGEILMLSNRGQRAYEVDGKADVRFALTGCLPIKLKAPTLNAKDGAVAIEEMQVAYECLSRVASGGDG